MQAGYGFSTYWSFQEPTVTPEYGVFCAQMARRGCQYVRANVPWEDIEPQPGSYSWDVPDQLLDVASAEGISLQFWMFPTTRGSGLSDGGVPRWILQEPALDRDGTPGFFPSLWSPFYRKHYFAMVDQLTRRYAHAAALSCFVLDFGNSDFPYGYNYYYNDPTLFDYSPWERDAFARYLREAVALPLDGVSELFGRRFADWAEVPVPFVEQPAPFREYLSFRTWSIRQGIEEVWRICRANAPSKVPPDMPGHGLGSISDLHAAALESKARHWVEEQAAPPALTAMHNAGPTWGGEPWQVAGGYPQYDPHLFSSVRYNAFYFSIPGPDLGVNGEDITRVGLVRRTIMGASRPVPRIAVLDDLGARDSLSRLAVRLDQEVDLITPRHRYDLACYSLVVLPPADRPARTETGGGPGYLLPRDEDWYVRLLSSIERGLHVLVFPASGDENGKPHRHLRKVLGIEDVRYGPRRKMSVAFPGSFGGGTTTGMSASVEARGETILSANDGSPVLVRVPRGRGGIFLAGYDGRADSLDRGSDPWTSDSLGEHTLARLCLHLGLGPTDVSTGQLNLPKSLLRRGAAEYLVLLNDRGKDVDAGIALRCAAGTRDCLDLVSGQVLPLASVGTGVGAAGSMTVNLTVPGGQGRYLALRKEGQ
jgi:hypothetical protein